LGYEQYWPNDTDWAKQTRVYIVHVVRMLFIPFNGFHNVSSEEYSATILNLKLKFGGYIKNLHCIKYMQECTRGHCVV